MEHDLGTASTTNVVPTSPAEVSSDMATGAAKDAAGAGAVPSPYSRAQISKSKIQEASAAEAKLAGVSRDEVMKNYKTEHKRLREQMKAKLKAEYMERLRRERAAKKRKAGQSLIGGEGKSKDGAGDGSAPAMMGALGMKSAK